MTPAAIAAAFLTYGPQVLPVIQSLAAMIRDKKTEVTPEDIAELIRLGSKTSADYLAAAAKEKAASS